MDSHFPATRRLVCLVLAIFLLGSACNLFSPAATPALPRTASPEPPSSTDTPVPSATQPQPEAQPSATAPVEPTEAGPLPVSAPLPVFASFDEPSVRPAGAPAYPERQPGLANVFNPFILSGEQLARLERDGVVVSPGVEKEFFTLYERARYDNVPIFVTSDSLLHSYHLLFDKVLRTAETSHFIPLLAELNQALLAQAEAQYVEFQGTPWEEAAMRTVAFVGVGSRLQDPAVVVPAYAAGLVDQEIALVEAAAGILPSPLFPGLEFGEDYTQYIPRGHYTRSEALQAYFKSMMWYGRMTFRLKTKQPEVGRAETRSALLLVRALRDCQVSGRPAMEAWADLYSPTVFFVGRSDDLTPSQYLPLIDQVYGPQAGPEQLTDEARLDLFIEIADRLPPPRILGIVISENDDEVAQTKGLRFMGQRFVPDAYIFRQLMYRNVGTPDHARRLPKGLDIPAAMGSARAYQLLDEMGETAYANYPAQMDKMRTWLSGLPAAEWTETLYNAWLYSFYPLLAVPGQAMPAFMQSRAWLDKQLNTVLGSWAELKHDTILYAKQAYAELGGGPPPPEPVPPRGYVEPVPQFFARLAALTAMTSEGLSSRGMLEDADRSNLERLHGLATRFQAMAEKELNGEALTEDDYTLIRFYGGDLEHLVMASADSDTTDAFARQYMDEDPQAAVIADVATDPDHNADGISGPAVLEVAVGRVDELHAVVPLVEADGSISLQIAKGGVFSYHEFVWPAADRLTDEKWRALLEGGQAPPQPAWSSGFKVLQGGYADLQRAVLQFQKQLTDLFWGVAWNEPDFSGVWAPFQADFQRLRENQQYEGRQLVRADFASFDLQSEALAVATVRETWNDTRYEGEYPDFDQPVVARRGPYTLMVTYTLERQPGAGWSVTAFHYAAPPPEWVAAP
jgi:hypothetical protein